MRHTSWFTGRKKRDELERQAQELAAEAERDRKLKDLRTKIRGLVERDPRYRFCTFDGLNWICPYTGRIINAPFDFEKVARSYLMQQRPWEEGGRLMSLLRLRQIAWEHYLRDQLHREQRLMHFHRERWLNPFTGQWVEDVPRGTDGSVTAETVTRLASALNASERSQERTFKDNELLGERLQEVGEQAVDQATAETLYASVLPDALDETPTLASPMTAEEILIRAEEPLMLDLPAMEQQPGGYDSDASQSTAEGSEQQAVYDSDRARSVQARMLPRLQAVPGLHIGVHYQPHDTVSGDFYDLQILPDGRLLVALGDVSGHGLQAGLVVQSTIKALRYLCRETSDLVEIVNALNSELIEDLLQDQFITAWMAAIDPEELHLDSIWCGHHPLIAARQASGALLNVVGQRGAALGLLKPELFARTISMMHLDLQPGDVIFQYTDGANEAMDGNEEEYGEHRLCGSFVTELLREETVDPQGLVDRIAASITDWADGRLADDLTLLALRFQAD
ncbi:MAG: PP2C family protein-serine/threonine phosphatase [Planctomycetota bacterium]